MKLQDVILKAIANKKFTWLEAAEIEEVCDGSMCRTRKQYEEFGYSRLSYPARRNAKSRARVDLCGDTYRDLSLRPFHEKMNEEHAIEISYR